MDDIKRISANSIAPAQDRELEKRLENPMFKNGTIQTDQR